MAVQISFLNQLIVNEETLDEDIIRPLDRRYQSALLAWDKCDRFALDIETYGEHPGDGLNPWLGSIRLLQIGLPDNRVIVVDLGGWDGKADTNLDGFLTRLEKHLRNPNKIVMGANLKFDLLFLKVKYGFEARCCQDVMLMSQVLWAGLPINHSLKAIASRIGIEIDKTQQMSEWGFELNNNQLNYAAKDVKVIFPIWKELDTLLRSSKVIGSATFENVALPCFVQMEYYGMPVDYELLLETIDKYEAVTTQVLQPFSDIFPGVNPDSSQQVISAVKEKLNIDLIGTSQEALAAYWDNPALKAISLWRTLTTYLDYFYGIKAAYFDGAVRGVYRQINPSGFGRSTCGSDKKANRVGVNLQNPPARVPEELEQYNLPPLRTVFRASENDTLLVSDLSSAHARIACEVSRDRTLTEAYNSGADIHAITAAGIAKLQGRDWTPDYITKARKDKSNPDNAIASQLRQLAKPVFYGSLNCQGAMTLKVTVQKDCGLELSEEESKAAIAAWKETYAGIHRFQQQTHRKANSRRYTFDFCKGEFGLVTGASGRKAYLPMRISDFSRDKTPQVKISDCSSFVWTSCEADIIKGAMGVFLLRCDENPEWGVRICNMAHDEVDVICNKDFAPKVAEVLQANMRAAMAFFIKTIPPDDLSSKPDSLIVNSWADK
ncbi:DNA polymerase I [Chlorogloeopsis fritschii PCC 6912]|uniref:DNA polymerase I n=1 Tax=Chlorogloeopsis fritschii PCC 6912 TaxID=211165 RepID=A0A3S1AE77_CHLFR|nr:DNA polymerase [Chlorogloeopsis fritschii]RUR77068.1 DNA polymerase I [Chlorogloeopsis fritschii PCC 6912]